MTKEEARAIYHQGEESVVAKLLEYDVRLIKLEEILGLNSKNKNSSKPSSTDDPFKKKSKSTENDKK